MTEIQKYMMATFLRLRVGIGIIGIIFPFLLWGGGKLVKVSLADSMSAYYHASRDCLDPKRPTTCKALNCSDATRPETCTMRTPVNGTGPMRNYFVGILFIIGAVMFLMKGFSIWEDWALNIAGVMAIFVAIFPMPWMLDKYKGFPTHGAAAFIFFGCIAFVCAVCSEKTLKYIPNETVKRTAVIKHYQRWYRFLAAIMLLSPFTAYVFNKATRQNSKTFWAEAFGILAFGAYWLFKTAELRRSQIERKALMGEVHVDTSKLVKKDDADLTFAAK